MGPFWGLQMARLISTFRLQYTIPVHARACTGICTSIPDALKTASNGDPI